MKKIWVRYMILILLGVSAAVSCKVTKPYKTPVMHIDSLYRDSSATDTNTIADLHWTQLFTDTLLQKLIQEGIDQNINLKVAYTRMQQAYAYLEQSKLAFYPSLTADAGVSAARSATTKTTGSSNSNTLYQLGASVGWEADIWGKLRSNKRANLANLLQSDAYARVVQTDLIATIADDYYSLLALDKQLQITQQTVQNWIATVEIMKSLKEADVVTSAAVVQSEASRYAVEVTIPDLKRNIRETENALSILLGRVPGPVERDSLAAQQPISMLQTGVPAQLLSNRPDVQQAEYNFRYSFELTNVARTYFYPSLTINASGGFNGTSLGNLFNPGSLVGSIAAGLFQPIFSQGVNRTRLKVARAQQQEALLNFQQTLLTAGLEVSNFLSDYQAALEKTNARDNQMVNLQKAVEYTQELVRYSSANYTEVLTAQQSLLSAQLNQVNDQLQKLQANTNLYRALGGGWK
ncbi:MAG TPA: efflux transporter outer membrane subunit [Puia sp.]